MRPLLNGGTLGITDPTNTGGDGYLRLLIAYHQAGAGVEASLLAETLRKQGYRVFLDLDTHQVGDLEQLTRRALEDSKGVVALLGPHFAERVGNERDWVCIELQAAQRSGKKVLPIVLPNAESNLRELPESLAWFGRTRWITFAVPWQKPSSATISRSLIGHATLVVGGTDPHAAADEASKATIRYARELQRFGAELDDD